MSAWLDYHVVDVFTHRAYAGNPLAVVLGADALSGTQMQHIAREFNLSETTFVLAPTHDEATYRVRIFTPAAELPFAGHPSIGTAWVLHSLDRYAAGPVVQECGAGLLPIVVDAQGAELTGGAATSTEPEPAVRVTEALGLTSKDLAGTPVRRCGCGLAFAYLHVHDDALARVTIDTTRLDAVDAAGVCAFSFTGTHAHARTFAGGVGVAEDPATGSAALGLGVFLTVSGLLPPTGTSEFAVSQGAEIGRPSRLDVTVRADAGAVVEARVRGGVVPVATGRILPPAAAMS